MAEVAVVNVNIRVHTEIRNGSMKACTWNSGSTNTHLDVLAPIHANNCTQRATETPKLNIIRTYRTEKGFHEPMLLKLWS